MSAWQPVYVGVGSNLDDPRAQVLRALERLALLPRSRLVLRSRLYGSKPLGPVAQPDFVNAAAALLTQLDVEHCFGELRELERALGRTPPRERWGPRVIDLDLLAFAREQRSSAELTLPHPQIAQRNFVLYPLAEIAAELELPGAGRVAQLQAAVASEGLWVLP
jgi:2-amino-4-hydroxy-6-hydroxymethyldihydropteridine diphosphokinase